MSDESPRALAAFDAYCELGPDRSLAKLADKWGKNKSYVNQLQRWSSQYSWQARVKKFDHDQALARQKRRARQLDDMLDRQAQQGERATQLALETIEKLQRYDELQGQQAVTLFKAGADVEYRARGGAERVELTGKDGGPVVNSVTVDGTLISFNLRELTREEIDLVKAIAKSMHDRQAGDEKDDGDEAETSNA